MEANQKIKKKKKLILRQYFVVNVEKWCPDMFVWNPKASFTKLVLISLSQAFMLHR